jgi:hypothetical protein
MSYVDGEKLVKTQVEAATGFSSSNVTRGNWKILNSGENDHYAILKAGEAVISWDAHSISNSRYRTIIEVWQRVIDDQASYDAVLTYADNIRTRIEPYRKLADTADTVLDANFAGRSAVTEQWRNNADGPSWFKIELYLDWSEQTNVTFAE